MQNSFFRQKKNDLKVADVARWEGVTMTFRVKEVAANNISQKLEFSRY